MSRAMAVLLTAAAAVLALIVPLNHGVIFIITLIATGLLMGGGTYAASNTSEKKRCQFGSSFHAFQFTPFPVWHELSLF